MVEKIHFQEEDILGFEVKGKFSEPAFVQLMQELIPAIESPGHVKLYIEIPRLDGMDWQVIWDSLKFAAKELGNYFEKVDKIAFVTDTAWLRFLATAEYTLISSIKEKSFSFDEREEALRWVKATE